MIMIHMNDSYDMISSDLKNVYHLHILLFEKFLMHITLKAVVFYWNDLSLILIKNDSVSSLMILPLLLNLRHIYDFKVLFFVSFKLKESGKYDLQTDYYNQMRLLR